MYPPYKREENGITYYYGSIGKGVYFDTEEIRIIDDSGSQSFETNEKGRLINFDTTLYMYIPSIHRFAMLKDNKISINDFLKFLQSEIPKSIDKIDRIVVDYERNSSIIDQVFKAKTVYSLSYEISYTNNDALDAQDELFDEMLKEAHVGILRVEARADHHDDGLDINKADILKSGLQLAKNNGVIKKARILPQNSTKKETLTNTETPKIEVFETHDNQNENKAWFLRFFQLFEQGEV